MESSEGKKSREKSCFVGDNSAKVKKKWEPIPHQKCRGFSRSGCKLGEKKGAEKERP